MQTLENGVGLGTFPFASPFTPVADETAVSIIRKYLRLGGSYFDVAPTYAFGRVEELLGSELRRHKRQSFFVNSFCGYVLDDSKQYVKSGRYEHVLEDCNASLARLQLDYLDLYTNHIPDETTPFSETIGAMQRLKEDGKIRHIGVSNVTLEQLATYNAEGAVEYVEMRFSLLNQHLTSDFISYCTTNNIGIIAYQVIERGLLTDKIIQGLELRDNDLRRSKPEFGQKFVATIRDWVYSELRPIARDLNVPVATLAIWWAKQQPGIVLCQCGVTNEQQLDEIIQAASFSPPVHTLSRVDTAYAVLQSSVKDQHGQSVREFMGLAGNMYQNLSASGKVGS